MLLIYRKIHDNLFHSFLMQYMSDARLLLSGVQLSAQEETLIDIIQHRMFGNMVINMFEYDFFKRFANTTYQSDRPVVANF